MATKEKGLVTDLVGQGIEFEKMPNPEFSEKRGMIRAVRPEAGGLILTVQIFDTDRLSDWPMNLGRFKLVK